MAQSANVNGIIHEMGHVFATKHRPESQACNEPDFLGWEIALARSVGAFDAWSEDNASYTINHEDGYFEWGDLCIAPSAVERRIVAGYIKRSRNLGLVSTRNRPLAIR